MKLLFITNNTFIIDGTSAMLRVETDGSMLYVTLGKIPRATVSDGFFSANCTYNGEVRDLSSNDLAGKTAVFPYSDSVKEITISGNEFYYNNAPDSSLTFAWKGGASDIIPDVSVGFAGLRYGDRYKFTFSYGDNAGHKACLIAMYANTRRDSDGRWFRITLVNGKRKETQISGTVTSIFNGRSRVEFSLYFACYKTDSDGIEDYVGLYEYVSPVYTISEKGSPYAPHSLNYEVTDNGNAVSWEYVTDSEFPGVSFELERSVGGGDFSLIYAGYEKHHTDTGVPVGSRVEYRVRAVSGEDSSPWINIADGSPASSVTSNVYVSVGGEMIRAAGVYVGVDGIPVLAKGQISVG